MSKIRATLQCPDGRYLKAYEPGPYGFNQWTDDEAGALVLDLAEAERLSVAWFTRRAKKAQAVKMGLMNLKRRLAEGHPKAGDTLDRTTEVAAELASMLADDEAAERMKSVPVCDLRIEEVTP